jgi:hypothetical protein
MPPSQLFDYARNRFAVSLSTLQVGGRGIAPSVHVTTLAMQQMDAGVRLLKSSLVPSTPFEMRARAASAIDQVAEVTSLLQRYRTSVVPFEDRSPRRTELQPSALLWLDSARARLQAVIGSLA